MRGIPHEATRIRCATAMGAVCTLVVLLALVSRQTGAPWAPLVICAAFAHQLLLAAPVGVLALALAQRRRASVVSAGILLLAMLTQVPLYHPTSGSPDGLRIVVLQENLRRGQADPAALVRTVERHEVDVLMTEELTPNEEQRLIEHGLLRRLPYSYRAPDQAGRGLALWSRFPISDQRRYDGFELGALSVALHLPGGRQMTAFAVHIRPPYPGSPGGWRNELTALGRELAAASRRGGFVVGGDFNATRDNIQFRTMASRYHEAGDVAGAGYLATYPAHRWYPPLIAIDHILTDTASVTAVAAVQIPGSDHRGLLAHLVLEGG